MPLISAGLQASLFQIFTSQRQMTPRLAAQKMAKAYDNYARTAMAAASTPVITGLEAQKLEQTLYTAISNPRVGMAPIIAAAWGAGVMAYWMAPPVPFVGPQTGMVLQAATVVPIITAGLTACFSNVLSTESLSAQLMSTALDAATRTVMVTLLPPPPAPPVPVVVPLT
jgi:uncharacterized protein (DUF486 family)